MPEVDQDSQWNVGLNVPLCIFYKESEVFERIAINILTSLLWSLPNVVRVDVQLADEIREES